MKKSLIALAVLSAAGAASAQSSVTLFGVVDATIQHIDNRNGSKVTRLHHSGYNSSRLGFRGTEDLGGGMSASFWLEAGMANDSGEGLATNVNNQASGTGAGAAGRQGLTFNRRSTVSLAGGFGEVRLGRDYTPQFWNLSVFDPFGTVGVGGTQTLNSIITGVTAIRASNSIGYFLPARLGGFYGQIQYYMGENPRNTTTAGGLNIEDDGRGLGLRVGFASGPFNVAVATSRTDYAVGDVRQTNIGGQWDFGMAKVQAHFSRDRNAGVEGRGGLIGGLIPLGAGEIRLAYSQYETDLAGEPRSRKLALGYVHNLSKRTALYTTVARIRNNGGANASIISQAPGVTTVNGASNGFDFGVRHSF